MEPGDYFPDPDQIQNKQVEQSSEFISLLWTFTLCWYAWYGLLITVGGVFCVSQTAFKVSVTCSHKGLTDYRIGPIPEQIGPQRTCQRVDLYQHLPVHSATTPDSITTTYYHISSYHTTFDHIGPSKTVDCSSDRKFTINYCRNRVLVLL